MAVLLFEMLSHCEYLTFRYGAAKSPNLLSSCAGASDCAACVGTALEIARVIVASPDIQLAVPLMLLLNGGEETVLTAAHGFMKTSKWASSVGAFINLESTGPAGPDVLFQHTGESILLALCDAFNIWPSW